MGFWTPPGASQPCTAQVSKGCPGPAVPAAPGVPPSRRPRCRGAGWSRGCFQVVRLRWGAAAAGTAEEEGGSQSWRSPPLFGEAAQLEFQEAITLVETSFLWPGRVTWLRGDERQAGPPVWAGSHPGSCRRPGLCPPEIHTWPRGRASVVYPPPSSPSPVCSPPPSPATPTSPCGWCSLDSPSSKWAEDPWATGLP